MQPKFLADAMLKNLAEWLRMLGIYCEYDFSVGKEDSRIISYAKRNNLVLLTRDSRMLPSLRKRKVRFLYLPSTNLEEQLAAVLSSSNIAIRFPEKTRCPKCNGQFAILRSVPRSAVPPKIYARKRKFWKCRGCGKIYWKGSHWKNLLRSLSRVRKLLRKRTH